MSRTDVISSGLNALNMYSKSAKKECIITPSSKLLVNVLKKFKDLGYVREFELIDNGKGGLIKIELTGRINECRSVRPRHSVKTFGMEKFEKRYLPARNFGHLIISTPEGIMTHLEAKKKGLGGKLLAYVY